MSDFCMLQRTKEPNEKYDQAIHRRANLNNQQVCKKMLDLPVFRETLM